MCLAVPARIVELQGDTAVVDVNGVRRTCNVSFIAAPKLDDYVLIHAGFAIQKWSEEDVREFEEIMKEMAQAEGRPG